MTPATVQVIDAQYGGILARSASVLVVVDQWRSVAGHVAHSGTTVDVRLVADRPRWRVNALYPAQLLPGRALLPEPARRVLADPRIRLPVAARADVGSGTIATPVLLALSALARDHVIDVSVVKTGHPLFVFGTNRRSDHPRGHAVDIWAVDDRAVVDPAHRALALAIHGDLGW